MLRILFITLMSTSFIWAQKFSDLSNASNTFLNFEIKKSDALSIFIDEGTALAWQNTPSLSIFNERSSAELYCKNLKLGTYTWVLPSSNELKSLPMYSNIAFGHQERYMASDGPIWDNTRIYIYDAKLKKRVSLLEDKQNYFVRCVARLED